MYIQGARAFLEQIFDLYNSVPNINIIIWKMVDIYNLDVRNTFRKEISTSAHGFPLVGSQFFPGNYKKKSFFFGGGAIFFVKSVLTWQVNGNVFFYAAFFRGEAVWDV